MLLLFLLPFLLLLLLPLLLLLLLLLLGLFLVDFSAGLSQRLLQKEDTLDHVLLLLDLPRLDLLRRCQPFLQKAVDDVVLLALKNPIPPSPLELKPKTVQGDLNRLEVALDRILGLRRLLLHPLRWWRADQKAERERLLL